MENSIIIIRGIPGSGKSTLARNLSEQGKYPVYCIDDYFTDPKTGEYHFNYQNNHLAYKDCEERTELAMQNNMPKIIVDNAFTLEWEMEPYFQLAKKYNYLVFVVTTENRHNGKNIHGIPEEQIAKMRSKFKTIL